MNRKLMSILLLACLFTPPLKNTCAAETLPQGQSKPALTFSHFPDRMHAFVWRNWESVSLEKMAEVLGTNAGNVRAVGESMGLPPYKAPSPDIMERGYISIIRRNWHLLPYDQLLQLLGWNAEKLAFTLKEDDFLWVKLGLLKPDCEPLRYEKPDSEDLARCREIRDCLTHHFDSGLAHPVEERFGFVTELTHVDPARATEVPKRG